MQQGTTASCGVGHGSFMSAWACRGTAVSSRTGQRTLADAWTGQGALAGAWAGCGTVASGRVGRQATAAGPPMAGGPGETCSAQLGSGSGWGSPSIQGSQLWQLLWCHSGGSSSNIEMVRWQQQMLRASGHLLCWDPWEVASGRSLEGAQHPVMVCVRVPTLPTPSRAWQG